MRFGEFRILTEAKVGREYQHLEDLVFVDGSQGANKAADILDNLGTDSSDVAIKWDGNPTIYWGREDNGEFVMVGKNGWGRQRSTSSADLSKFIKTSGKGEEWREKFGNDMAQIFDILKSSTPPSTNQYVYGDLLYHPGNPYTITDGKIQFTPNKVTYTVDVNSDMGKRIAQSKVGVTVHTRYNAFGDKDGQPVNQVGELNSKDVVVLGQTYVSHQPTVKSGETDSIRKLVQKNGKLIDSFLAPVKGLSDMKNIIYTYVNHMTRTKQLQNIEKGFFDWLGTSKVSANKQAKIQAMHNESPQALLAIFGLVKQIMLAKDDIIDQLDDADADIKASTGDERGGEGYVAQKSKIKLVPRSRWQPN
jgi:hypothetical protein